MNILKSSLKMAVATFCSRILGLVREQVMAHMFGASGLTDAFLVAFRIPNLLRDLFAEGAFSSAFVPTFVETRQKSEDEAKQLMWSLFILLGSVTASIGLLTCLFAEPIVVAFAPDFAKDPHKLQITANLTRIMSPFLFLVSIAALFMGTLNSLRYFFLPSLAPAFFNVASILSMLFFPELFQWWHIEEIYVMGWGVLFGGVLQMLVQFPLLIKSGYGRPRFGQLINDKTKTIVKKLGPGMIGFAATQINLLVNTILATGAGVGAVSWLNYSFRLFQLPVGILSVSIGNSNLVHFSEKWKRGEKQGATDLLSSSYNLSLLVVVPALVVMVLFGDSIVHLIFERGRFSANDTAMTALSLKMYALGLPFYSIYKIFVPVFYTLDRQRVPVFCSIGTITFNVLFCSFLVPVYGFKVLALGTTISMFISVAIMEVLLMKYLDRKQPFLFHRTSFKIMVAAAVSAYFAWWLHDAWAYPKEAYVLERVMVLFGQMGTVGLIYFGSLIMLGENSLIKKVLRR